MATVTWETCCGSIPARTLLILMPGIMGLFFTGAAFAYFIMLPVAVGFLQNFLGTVINQEWTIDKYIGFVTRIVFWIGVFFETPLVIAFMARIGLVSGPKLRGYWRQAIVIISVVASADNVTGYVFGMHPNFDPEMNPYETEVEAAAIGDATMSRPHRKFARLWLNADYQAAVAQSAKAKAAGKIGRAHV